MVPLLINVLVHSQVHDVLYLQKVIYQSCMLMLHIWRMYILHATNSLFIRWRYMLYAHACYTQSWLYMPVHGCSQPCSCRCANTPRDKFAYFGNWQTIVQGLLLRITWQGMGASMWTTTSYIILCMYYNNFECSINEQTVTMSLKEQHLQR